MRTTVAIDDALLTRAKQEATDAWLAALAGSEWITTDRDFARFDRLRWRHPLRAGH
ncbi:MAG: hypothetical protein KY460_10575 [Actinobacteria bacterium]|nr:hypothetical protein [Actinomycetota bacterium]